MGKRTDIKLTNLEIYTEEEIAKTPVEVLEKNLGKWGESLWRKAHGIG